jgi:hypothetical protein
LVVDVEETEAKNDCAGEVHHIFNRPTETTLRRMVGWLMNDNESEKTCKGTVIA